MRGLKLISQFLFARINSRRIPHGMRGLKFRRTQHNPHLNMSHPAWDAWIEIVYDGLILHHISRRIPHGMRGLKYCYPLDLELFPCRIPHGMRGLKCFFCVLQVKKVFGRIPHGMRGLKFLFS